MTQKGGKKSWVNEQAVAGPQGLDGSEESLKSHEGVFLSSLAKEEEARWLSPCFQYSGIESYPKHITSSASLGCPEGDAVSSRDARERALRQR